MEIGYAGKVLELGFCEIFRYGFGYDVCEEMV